MKELSVEEKAKRYDEAIKAAVIAHKDEDKHLKATLERIFPELKESEDERIRKEIISMSNTLGKVEWIAWLEKQGEKDEEILILKDQIESLHAAIKAVKETHRIELEKQGEQKHADKVEPKFKVGDWVVYCGKTCKITRLQNGIFTITNQDGSYFFNQVESTTEPVFHRWTIQDAKPGDVLADGDMIVIFKENNYEPDTQYGCMFVYCSIGTDYCYFKESGGINPTSYKPATKEQRDLLFQKMKEAGYEWNPDTKELKKIEQKPAWSEEDERNLYYWLDNNKSIGNDKYRWLLSLKDRVQTQPKQEWSEEDEQYLLVCKNALAKYQTTDKWDAHIISHWLENKLKSLRPQNRWKPSNEQMETLEYYMHTLVCNEHKEILFGLYADLKKLREK